MPRETMVNMNQKWERRRDDERVGVEEYLTSNGAYSIKYVPFLSPSFFFTRLIISLEKYPLLMYAFSCQSLIPLPSLFFPLIDLVHFGLLSFVQHIFLSSASLALSSLPTLCKKCINFLLFLCFILGYSIPIT